MYLVVGLGNPGKEYENTRHNSGFLCVDKIVGSGASVTKKFEAEIIKEQNIIYIKPQTYMNLSGVAVANLLRFYKIKAGELIVIHDDLDLELGRVKVQKGGKSAGHNGVESIIEAIKTDDFIRVRIGIGRPQDQIPPEDYVLSKFNKEENDLVQKGISKATEAVEIILIKGYEEAMNKINGQTE